MVLGVVGNNCGQYLEICISDRVQYCPEIKAVEIIRWVRRLASDVLAIVFTTAENVSDSPYTDICRWAFEFHAVCNCVYDYAGAVEREIKKTQ